MEDGRVAAARRRGRLRVGIDTGETFSDVVAIDAVSGAMHVTKAATLRARRGGSDRGEGYARMLQRGKYRGE